MAIIGSKFSPMKRFFNISQISDNSFFVLTKKKIFLVNKDNVTFTHNEDILDNVEKIVAIDQKSIYGIGKKGFFVHYN